MIVGSWRDVGVMDYPRIMRDDYQYAVVKGFAGKCSAITKCMREIYPDIL